MHLFQVDAEACEFRMHQTAQHVAWLLVQHLCVHHCTGTQQHPVVCCHMTPVVVLVTGQATLE